MSVQLVLDMNLPALIWLLVAAYFGIIDIWY